MRFRDTERIADAVLYEGYVLYPYRASSMKNRVRWQFGIVAPRPPDEESGEPWYSQTECLVERGARPRLVVRLRCLVAKPAGAGAREASADLGQAAPAWLDGVPHTTDVGPVEVEGAAREEVLMPGGIEARLSIRSSAAGRFTRVRIRLENHEPWREAYAESRDAMLCRSLISAHLLLAVEDGAFVSLLDPPEDAKAEAAACLNRHTWPVLAGRPGERDVMLSSPIVLYDYPAIAPESPADLCDGTEIDELLSLRIMTLTEREKREARATDPRAAAIIDRAGTITPGELSRLHGTMRAEDFFNPPGLPQPEEASVIVAGAPIARGSRVRLRPGRRADAMDMFLAGQAATVAGVYRDVDERTLVAVTVDADPAADLHESFGRFFYFEPDELEPLGV